MKRRQWKSETKTMIVLEGLKGRAVAELCNAHQISQAQYNIINGVISFSRMQGVSLRFRPMISG